MARAGCVLLSVYFFFLLGWLQLPADEISSYVCTGSCTVPSCNMCHAALFDLCAGSWQRSSVLRNYTSELPAKINLRLPKVYALNVIYLRAPLTLGIQTGISVCWVASECPGCTQIPLEISRPICAALMQTHVAF